MNEKWLKINRNISFTLFLFFSLFFVISIIMFANIANVWWGVSFTLSFIIMLISSNMAQWFDDELDHILYRASVERRRKNEKMKKAKEAKKKYPIQPIPDEMFRIQ